MRRALISLPSFILCSLFEPQLLLQLEDIILEVLIGLLEKSKLEEDFVVHEKWRKDERCSEEKGCSVHFHIITTRRKKPLPPSKLSTKAGERPSWTPCP